MSAQTNSELLARVVDLVARTLDDAETAIGPETALFSGVERFDSFSIVELVLRIETTFGVSIPDEDLNRDVLGSPRAIAGYLEARLAAPTPVDGDR